MFVFASLEPVEENKKSRYNKSFLYLKDTDEVGLICVLIIT